MQLDKIITHEAQLSPQIQQSVAEGRQSDFALLLALLSDDATDFSAFKLLSTEQKAGEDSLFLAAKQSKGPQKPFAPEPFNGLIGQHNSELLKQYGIKPIQLNECLRPEPFATKNNKHYLPPLVVDNCHPAKQAQLKKSISVNTDEINIDSFYESIEKSQTANVNLVA